MKSFARSNVLSQNKKEELSPNEYPDLQCTEKNNICLDKTKRMLHG